MLAPRLGHFAALTPQSIFGIVPFASEIGREPVALNLFRVEGEIDGAWIEGLRRDPDVTVYRRTTDQPYVPTLRVTEPVGALWLLGRDCTDE